MSSRHAIGVGVIGVGSENSWAREAHVPAIRAVEGLVLQAVAARDDVRGEQVARAEGARHGYGDAAALIADPAVEVVVVGAPVPAHRALIEQALAAGKHVVTEWPVTVDAGQTATLADAVSTAGLAGVVDLQARHSAAVMRAGEIVAAGDLGRVLGVSVESTTAGWGPVIPAAARYLEDPANGMHLATIQTAHTLDLAIRLAGPLDRLAVLGTIQFPQVRVDGTDDTIMRSVADHLAVAGRFADGASLVVEMRAGCPPDDVPFRLAVRGTGGTLELEGGSPRGFQASALTLRRDGDPVEVAEPYAALPEAVRNVAGVYSALRDDLDSGSRTAPSFGHAAALGRLIADLLTAAENGRVVTGAEQWPQG